MHHSEILSKILYPPTPPIGPGRPQAYMKTCQPQYRAAVPRNTQRCKRLDDINMNLDTESGWMLFSVCFPVFSLRILGHTNLFEIARKLAIARSHGRPAYCRKECIAPNTTNFFGSKPVAIDIFFNWINIICTINVEKQHNIWLNKTCRSTDLESNGASISVLWGNLGACWT